MPRPKLGVLEQHRVDLLMEAIPRFFLSWDREVGKVLGQRGFPLGQFFIAAIEAQTQGKADRPTHIQAGDGVMGQGVGAITVVIVAVHIVNWLQVLGTTETPHIDQGVGHQFHPVVALLDVLENRRSDESIRDLSGAISHFG